MINKITNRIELIIRKMQAHYYASRVLDPFDENWFKGKRVAVIGGADSALKEKLGSYIDDFDVVVRINKGIEILEKQHEFVGRKTDILFHCFYEKENDKGSSPITPDLWKKHNVKKILFSHNYRCSYYSLENFLYFIKKTKAGVRFSQLKQELFLKNKRAIAPYGPTTGFIAINTIANCEPKELYITGVTFFKTPHNQSYRVFDDNDLKDVFSVQKHHNAEIEYQHVKKLYNQYPGVIRPDRTLIQIFETN